ncbi:MAG: DUF1345 domain-containing protein [Microbacteriaceae bacterium]|jgi:uncharacterized membrane protein|nr:DUF1345 domain-containing protein [Microbacteriaceae bacterium]HPZ33672.1 DUF1345 domain-containing protein [Microbacteriaceae bacterium]HQC93437.1 DUF1345 domain-containing protein [Microbacteriaceae bacterium]
MTTAKRWFSDVKWRLLVSLALGVAAGVVVGQWLSVAAGLIVGWSVAALIEVVGVLAFLWPMDGARTREHATGEYPGRQISRAVSMIGAIASLGAVGVVLLQSRSAHDAQVLILGGIGVLGVAASWLLIQTNYMLRYASAFYGDPVGGIDFHGGPDYAPMYTDFIYFSVGLGMTFQVADTDLTSNEMRRIAIGQTMLGWLFSTVIIATVINLVVGMASLA